MSEEEIKKFLIKEWDRLQAAQKMGEDLSEDDYYLWRLLRQVDGDSPEEQGLVRLIMKLRST